MYDEHCIVRFMGKNWRIARIKGKIWTLQDKAGNRMKMNVSQVRWDEYAEAMSKLMWAH